MDMLRFVTAGSVDDGKSTLIGRLLLDAKVLLEDQVAAARKASGSDGAPLNLAFFTDGLKSERERGVTIDVAYRYFSTPRRKFIVADCPGHFEYTRNMVTGASTADLAVILVDASKGLLEQTRRHCFVASLLGIPHLVLAVNKMDLAGWSEAAFERVRAQFTEFANKLEIRDVAFIPVCAKDGDNIVEPSSKTPWYGGRPLLRHLEEVHVASDGNHIDMRFVVQGAYAKRPAELAGYVASGAIRRGDSVMALPSGGAAHVKSLHLGGRQLLEAKAPLSLSVVLDDGVAADRGDVLARVDNRPRVEREFEAMVCWVSGAPFDSAREYELRIASRSVRVRIKRIYYRIDINSLSRLPSGAGSGEMEFAKVMLECDRDVCVDPFRRNRVMGSFILTDLDSCATAAAGMVL